MSSTKKIDPEEVTKKFEALKRRTEIKERYGVFTQQMLEELLEGFKTKIVDDVKNETNGLNEKLDWLIGEYKKFDEEHALLGNRVSDHDDRLEEVEKRLGITV